MLQWSSQTSASRKGKKGRELLGAMDNGTQVHIWLRKRKTDAEFVYAGMGHFVDDKDEKPIQITWRLYDALPQELYVSLRGDQRSG